MKVLLILILFTDFNYGYLAHLHGYYTTTETGYNFKHCYEDETRTIIQKDDIKIVIDYLEEKYDTELRQSGTDQIKIWSSVIRKDGIFYELSIVGITPDGINYTIEVMYRKLKNHE